jgi:transposase-like protein
MVSSLGGETQERKRAMTRKQYGGATPEGKAGLAADPDSLRPLVQGVVEEVLESEMTEALQARKGDRVPAQRLSGQDGRWRRTPRRIRGSKDRRSC